MALSNSIAFDPNDPLRSLDGLPEAPGVFALYPEERPDERIVEPYLSKTANLRRRLLRLLRPAQSTEAKEASDPNRRTRRLELAHKVRRVEYSVTGSEFESLLRLYNASLQFFGERARRRLRLRPPAFLRMSLNNPYPRVYFTTRITKTAARTLFGPFPSRAAAERYAEEVLNLFLLRRCTENLNPDPAFPGCPYSEMKMCLAPCYKGCSDERYQQESDDVLAFLSTHGESLLKKLERERSAASEALEFERASGIHQRMQKLETAARLASEAVRPLSALNGILVQPAAEAAALFALHAGVLHGPVLYSTAGMRLANERSGSTSLFAQPVAVEAVPLEGQPKAAVKDLLEQRLDQAFRELERTSPKNSSSQVLSDHLALFTRWYYRPGARRVGEIVFAGEDGQIPRKALLRTISRVVAKAAGREQQQ